MCGRTRSTQSAGELAAAAGARLHSNAAQGATEAQEGHGVAGDTASRRWERYGPRENVHPGNTLCALVNEEGARVLRPLVWGLVPSFHAQGERFDFFRMFNARSETLAHKPVFKRLLRRPQRRCVVLVDGFYEWTKDASGEKQPYYLHADAEPLRFAGLWDTWRNQEDGAGPPMLDTCTIVTTAVHRELDWLHTRMPVLLRAEEVDAWLGLDDAAEATAATPADAGDADAEDAHAKEQPRDDGATLDAAMRLCQPKSGLRWHPVSKKMNKMSYDEADCATEIRLAPPPKPITDFFGKTRSKKGDSADTPGASAASPRRERSREERKEALAEPTAKRPKAAPSTAHSPEDRTSPSSKKKKQQPARASSAKPRNAITNFFAAKQKT